MRHSYIPEVDALLLRQHGVISTAQLKGLGLTDSQIFRLHSAERWSSPTRGIYHAPSHPYERLQLMVVTCLLAEDASIGFTTAGQETGMRSMSFDRRVHALLPHENRLAIPGVWVHRSRRIDDVDLSPRRSDGIRFTSPARTVLDSASIIGQARTESVIEQLLADSRCSLETLASTARRLYHPKRPGSAVMLGVIEGRPALRGAVRSDLELVVLRAIAAQGLPRPEINMPYQLANGDPIFIDLAWVEWKVAGEVDHPFWHDGVAEAAKDKRRDRKLQAEGWVTPRFPLRDIESDLDELVGDIDLILRQRGWHPGSLAA